MKGLDDCPSAEALEKLLAGDATEEEIAALESHLNHCQACCERVESLTAHAALEDDLHWAASVRSKTFVTIGEPLSKLNELLPDYEILREIGRGGMGIVYLANQPRLNRQVAIKVLPALLGVIHPESKARFRREAELAAGLDHTNIISIHDYGEADGTLYYAMQLIRGRSLRNVLDEIEESGAVDCVVREKHSSRTSRLSSGTDSSAPQAGRAYYLRVAHWISEVADALQYAHDRGITHRDIKPSNLLLTEDGKLMISDFGLARIAGAQSITQAQSLVGTCRYMAPEQLRPGAAEADHLVDIYALGATLYELLAFRPMFSGTDDRNVIHQIGSHEPTPPHRISRSVPRELETICLKAICKDRDARYASAGDFADDLRRWSLGLPIEAKRSPLPVRAVKLARRHKLAVTFSALSIVLALASGVLLLKYDAASKAEQSARTGETTQRALALVHQARLFFDEERYADAIARLDEALRLAADLHEASQLKAVALVRQGQNEQARQILNQAIASDETDWRSRYLLGMLTQSASNPFGRSRAAKAETDPEKAALKRSATIGALLSQVEHLHAGSPEVLCLRSALAENHTESIRLLSEALELDPRFTDALVERALRLGCVGQFEAALADLDAAIAARHGGHQVHGLRGIALYQLGRWGECEQAFSEAIDRNPLNVDWWYNRAVVRTYLGRFALAIDDATQALALDAQYPEALVARGRGYAGIGRLTEAMADYNRAAELAPTMADIFVERGLISWNMGDYEHSLADANTLIGLEPNRTRGYQRRAQTYLRLEEWDLALADLDRCDEIDPTDFATPTIRGGVYYSSERYAEAALAFAVGQKRRPDDYGNYSFHAICRIRLGQTQAALAPLTEWISLANNKDLGLMRRGMLYEMLGEYELALADYDEASRSARLGLYPNLWAGICLALQGEKVRADQRFDACSKAVSGGSWEASILGTVRGVIPPSDLIAQVRSDAQRTEACYYAGIANLLKGDTQLAAQSLTECASNGNIDILETDFALLRHRVLQPTRP